MDKLIYNFNKEIVFGEFGALVSAPLTALIVSKYTKINTIISSSAVMGAIIGASIFWLVMRIYDKKRNKTFSIKNLGEDIAYFTPAAFLITFLVYYPILFVFSKHLLTQDYRIISSVFISQTTAFSLFLISINIYRYILKRFFKEQL